MKNWMRVKLSVVLLIGVHVAVPVLAEGLPHVIYQDTFSTDGSLSGRTVESGFGNWVARPELITANGVAIPGATYPGKNGLLPFVPRSGKIYRLSADMNAISNSWAAMGFVSDTNSTIIGNEFFYNYVDTESPWMYVAPNGNVNTYTGPANGGSQQSMGVGSNGTLEIELDTSGNDWKATYSFNGTVLRINTFPGSLNITHVGFGSSPISSAEVDNFKLEVIEASPEVSINFDYRDLYEIWDTSLDLDFMRTHLDELSIHNWIIDIKPDATLVKLFGAVDTYGFDLSMEFGALRYDPNEPDRSGEIAADSAVSLLDRVTGLGGSIRRIYFDHPWQLRYVENPDFGAAGEPRQIPSGMSWEDSIREMADFIEIVGSNYPDIEMWSLPAFINYGWKGERSNRTITGELMSAGDYYLELTQLLAECRKRGIRLDGVLIDSPYDGTAGLVDESGTVFYNGPPDEFDWFARIRDLEYETEIRGLDFGIINNNPVGTNTYAFYTKSLKYIEVYTGAPYHGSPTVWAPWSWYQSPYHFAPEHALIGDPEYSYTIGVLANAVIDRVKVMAEDINGSYWGFSDNGFGALGGWQWGNILSPVFDAGYLKTASTTGDGWIGRDDVFFDGNLHQTVETALAVDGGSTLRLYYQVNNGVTWYEAPSISLNPDGQTHVYSFDLQNSSQWIDGMVTAIRLDPTDTVDVSCWLDYIWIKSSPGATTGYKLWAGGWGQDIGNKTDDFDHDDLNNLGEYGLGGDPTNELNQGISPVFNVADIGGSNVFRYVYPQLSDPNSGLAYSLELTTNLVEGTWINAGYEITGIHVTGNTLDFVTNVVADTEDDKKYIRLVIEAL